jgi:hypothetical protein
MMCAHKKQAILIELLVANFSGLMHAALCADPAFSAEWPNAYVRKLHGAHLTHIITAAFFSSLSFHVHVCSDSGSIAETGN